MRKAFQTHSIQRLLNFKARDYVNEAPINVPYPLVTAIKAVLCNKTQYKITIFF